MSDKIQTAAEEFLVRYGGDTFPNLFRSAKGTIVKDVAGREYLDFTSGQMCATIGHNHPAIVEAVHRAGEKAFHFFSGMIPEVVVELAQTLARDWLPGDIKKTIFINTGSEANEVALRMAKMYTGGYEILVLGGSWHGLTGGASSVSMASDRKGYGVPAPGVFVIPEPNSYRPYIKSLPDEEGALVNLEVALKLFDMQSTGRGAAIIVEPVISAGGVLVPPRSFMHALRKAADDRGMLLIFDEAQTAFGRIGKKTGSEHFGVVPDIMTMSKTLGGGLPLAAVSTTAAIEEDIHDKHFAFYTSHVSDPLPAEVGLAVLKVIAEEPIDRPSKRDGCLPTASFRGFAAALRGYRRCAGPRTPLGRRIGRGSGFTQARACARRFDYTEMFRDGPEHEHSKAARAGLGLADRVRHLPSRTRRLIEQSISWTGLFARALMRYRASGPLDLTYVRMATGSVEKSETWAERMID